MIWDTGNCSFLSAAAGTIAGDWHRNRLRRRSKVGVFVTTSRSFTTRSRVYANSPDPVGLEELVGMLEAQHSTFSPIVMTFGDEVENQPIAWVETTDYPETMSEAIDTVLAPTNYA